MAELADALDSDSSEISHAGSSPVIRTINEKRRFTYGKIITWR